MEKNQSTFWQYCIILRYCNQLGNKNSQFIFRLLDKKLYITRKICYLVCECGKDYIGETKRNTTKSWLANDNLTEDSEPAM